MDPDENLKQQLEDAEAIIAGSSVQDTFVVRLAEHVLDLHAWLKNGGFLPKMWDRKAKEECDHQPDPCMIAYAGHDDLMNCTCRICGTKGHFTFKQHTAEIMWDA